VALTGGALVIALGACWIAAHVTGFALDETLMQQSALHYASNLPHSLFHDLDARATDRLYPLLLSIGYRITGGPAAIRLDHVLSALLFVSAVFPLYLVARVILRSRWAAVAVALLGVCAPWLALTSALFTENLSYPLFWWMMLATAHAVWRPAWRRDALAVLSIALLVVTRVQFAAVFPGYLLAILAVSLWRAGPPRHRGFWSDVGDRVRSAGAEFARCYPASLALLVATVVAVVYVRSLPNWRTHVENLFGTYSDVLIRHSLPPNMIEGLLVELIALALGVGLLPAIVSIPWYFKRMSRPRVERRWVFLLSAGVVLLVFLVGTVFSQGGYLGPLTEERYFFYVAPVFWLGAFAALEDRDLSAGQILACALGLSALFAVIPFLSTLTSDTAFLAPVESVVPHVLGQRFKQLGVTWLTVQEALAVLVFVAGAATALIWRRWPAARAWWVVAPAIGLQVLLTGYVFAVIDGKIQGIPGRTGGSLSALGWVDGHARSSDVAWLDNGIVEPAAGAPSLAVERMRTTLFWNSHLQSWAALPQLGLPGPEWPMAALPSYPPLAVDASTGELTPQPAASTMREVVSTTGSPFVQLAGSAAAQSPEHALSLIALSHPVRATWLTSGLQPGGYLVAGAPVHFSAFAPRSSGAQALAVTLAIVPPPAPTPGASAPAAIAVRLGPAKRSLTLRAGAAPHNLSFVACVKPGETAVAGSIRVVRPAIPGSVGGSLAAVTLTPLAPAAAFTCGRSSAA
jgi:hypothetical protein